MRICRIIGMTVFVLTAAALHAAPARSAVPSLNLPLTVSEQAARLRALAGPEMAQRLFPPTATEPGYYFQRDYRSEYRSALPYDRARLAERVGEQGRARFAANRGWVKLLGSRSRGIRQGPDSVYWDRRSGLVRVIEAKGGTAQARRFYGSPQNTNRYSIQSAGRVLRSPNATKQAKVASAAVIVAAQNRALATGVVRTPHMEGKPGAPRLEGGWNQTNVRREALAIQRDLAREKFGTRETFREARREVGTTISRHRAAQGLAVLGLAGAAVLGWDAYRQIRTAHGMFNDPGLDGSMLPYVQTGVGLGRIGQTTLSASSLAQLKLLGPTAWVRGAGAALLPVTLGVEATRVAKAYVAYGLGRISTHDFYREVSSASIVPVITAGGAIVGAIIGSQAGGVSAVPGAKIGTKIAVFVAIPLQLVADRLWEWYYEDFRVDQLQRVNAAIEKHYGLDSASDAYPR